MSAPALFKLTAAPSLPLLPSPVRQHVPGSVYRHLSVSYGVPIQAGLDGVQRPGVASGQADDLGGEAVAQFTQAPYVGMEVM